MNKKWGEKNRKGCLHREEFDDGIQIIQIIARIRQHELDRFFRTSVPIPRQKGTAKEIAKALGR